MNAVEKNKRVALACAAALCALPLISQGAKPFTATSDKHNDLIFNSEKIGDGITRIRDAENGPRLYLIEGSEKAVLIDSGNGAGNLRAYVETLTSKPVTVLVTHCHVGGAGGSGDFENVYMNAQDIKEYSETGGLPLAKRKTTAKTMFKSRETAKLLDDSDFPPMKDAADFKSVADGDRFELGGTAVIAYSVRGHTQGNMAYLATKQRTLFTGEGIAPIGSLMRGNTGLASYEKNLRTLASKIEGQFDTILIANAEPYPKELLGYLIKTCEAVRKGTAQTIFPNQKAEPNVVAATVFDDAGNKVGTLTFDNNLVTQ